MKGKFDGAKVLVADDDPIQLEILKELVTKTGADCIAVSDGKIALEAYRSSPEGHFKLVFTDINMPQMGGYELCHRIRLSGRSDAETIPVLGVSSDTDPDVFDKAVRCGMNGMTSKPVSSEVLKAYFTLLLSDAKMNIAFAARLQSRIDEGHRAREFAAGLCRDLRTPLRAITGFSEMLGEEKVSDDERRNYAESINAAASRVSKLLNDAEIRFSSNE